MKSTSSSVCRVLITGSNGLLGYHARAALLAENCAAKFKGEPQKYELLKSPRLTNDSLEEWSELVKYADLVLHFAGINRAAPEDVERGNLTIAELLVTALSVSKSKAHVIYANSMHSGTDTPYGRGKEKANEILSAWAVFNSTPYTNIVLPHIFGEKARPHYNNVTGTLCHKVRLGEKPVIHQGAKVELLHAGKAIDLMFAAYDNAQTGSIRLTGKEMTVSDLYNMLVGFRVGYQTNTYPDLSDAFTACLFNTYRFGEFPSLFPKELIMHSDQRGFLFEAVRGGGGGQTFLSWTEPGVERGNHFHRNKIERFLVISGSAKINVRPLFSNFVETFSVSGDKPAYIDMPTLHTHNIVNTGSEPLLTLFWTHEVFNPKDPDTYAHPVKKN